jgi:hypothetical protein
MESTLENSLHSGEKIVWRSKPNRRALQRDVVAAPLVGTYFLIISVALIAEKAAHANIVNAPLGLLLIFAVIGAGLASVHYWKGREADRTEYAITDQRALIRGPRKLESFPPSELLTLCKKRRGSGFGSDLILKVIPGTEEDTLIGFMAIEDADKAEQLIREMVQRNYPAAEIEVEDWDEQIADLKKLLNSLLAQTLWFLAVAAPILMGLCVWFFIFPVTFAALPLGAALSALTAFIWLEHASRTSPTVHAIGSVLAAFLGATIGMAVLIFFSPASEGWSFVAASGLAFGLVAVHMTISLPRCPKCGSRMRMNSKTGSKIFYACRCGEVVKTPVRKLSSSSSTT